MMPRTISYVHEANRWFASMAAANNFTYDSTNVWDNLNASFLSKYDVVLFLDTRPDSAAQRAAFQSYIEKGGAWMGFHFAGFALTPSTYPQNWDWYHNTFWGLVNIRAIPGAPHRLYCVWKTASTPLPATCLPPSPRHPTNGTAGKTICAQNPDIDILLSIDPKSFPLGTGPKPHEIWHEGYYPVAWTNKRYRMIYVNMGHNDMDYEHGTNRSLSSTFSSPMQNAFFVDALLWLGKKASRDPRF